jgi:hypothetical protein
LSSAEINVETFKGVVQLSGFGWRIELSTIDVELQ